MRTQVQEEWVFFNNKMNKNLPEGEKQAGRQRTVTQSNISTHWMKDNGSAQDCRLLQDK